MDQPPMDQPPIQPLRGKSLRIMMMLHEAPDDAPLYARRITELTGLQHHEIGPIITRFLRLGWVTAERETSTHAELGRTPRRYFYITSAGRTRFYQVPLPEVQAATVKRPGDPITLRAELHHARERIAELEGRLAALGGLNRDEALRWAMENASAWATQNYEGMATEGV